MTATDEDIGADMSSENGGLVTELEIVKGIERLAVKLDQLLSDNRDHETRLRALEQRAEPPHQEHATKLAGLESRVSGLERWRWLVTGIAAGGGGAVGSVVTSLLIT